MDSNDDIKCEIDESSTESDTDEHFCDQCPSKFQFYFISPLPNYRSNQISISMINQINVIFL